MSTRPSYKTSGSGFEFYLGMLRQQKEFSHNRALVSILNVLGDRGGVCKLLEIPILTGVDVVEVAANIKKMMSWELVSLDTTLESSKDATIHLTDTGEKLLAIMLEMKSPNRLITQVAK